jgi:cell division protein FtsB
MNFSRKARREVLITLLILFSLCLLYQLVFGSGGFLSVRAYQEELSVLEQENLELEQENAAVADAIERLQNDPEELERIAREELNLARPGDVIITLPEKPPE